MAGIDRHTGRLLSGWDHVAQSIGVILTTAIGTRVMRRGFGSRVDALLDRAMVTKTVAVAANQYADALRKYEPRAVFERVAVQFDGPNGEALVIVDAVYIPDGIKRREQFSAVIASAPS